MGTRLILVRHGETVLGRERRYAGHTDTPLTPRGRRQILGLRRAFLRRRPVAVYSSDLARCRDSAALLVPDERIRLRRRLRELDFGAWEGRTADESSRLDPSRFERWMIRPEAVAPPRGETLRQLARRVRALVRDLAQRHHGETIALVTHAGPIRVLLSRNLSDFWNHDVPPAALRMIDCSSTRERKAGA